MARVTDGVNKRIATPFDLDTLNAKVQEKVTHLAKQGVRQIAISAGKDGYGVLYIDIEGVL